MLKPLPPKCKAIAEFRINNPTLTQAEVAKYFGLTPGRISSVLNMPAVKRHYPILMKQRVESMAPMALQAYQELVNQKDNLQVREKAAAKVLTESGVFDAPTVNVKTELTFTNVREMQEIVKRAAAHPDLIVDAEVISEQDTPE